MGKETGMSRLMFMVPMLSLIVAAEQPLEKPSLPRVEGKGPPARMIARDLKNPESVAIAPDGRVFVTTIGEFDKDGDG
ncbi:MAG: hypothetical protein ACKO23_12485, partial [Gemmataceae bacterium]